MKALLVAEIVEKLKVSATIGDWEAMLNHCGTFVYRFENYLIFYANIRDNRVTDANVLVSFEKEYPHHFRQISYQEDGPAELHELNRTVDVSQWERLLTNSGLDHARIDGGHYQCVKSFIRNEEDDSQRSFEVLYENYNGSDRCWKIIIGKEKEDSK